MISLRDATLDDLDVLAVLWRDAWIDGHAAHVPAELIEQRTLESFRIRLQRLLPDTRVAEKNGRIAGFCSLKGDELNQIMVARDARGSGVAAVLMTDAERRQRDRGHETVWLACAVGNDRAAAFYRKSGWRLARTESLPVETLGDPFPLEIWRFEKTV